MLYKNKMTSDKPSEYSKPYVCAVKSLEPTFGKDEIEDPLRREEFLEALKTTIKDANERGESVPTIFGENYFLGIRHYRAILDGNYAMSVKDQPLPERVSRTRETTRQVDGINDIARILKDHPDYNVSSHSRPSGTPSAGMYSFKITYSVIDSDEHTIAETSEPVDAEKYETGSEVAVRRLIGSGIPLDRIVENR